MQNLKDLERASVFRDSGSLKEAYDIYVSVAEQADNALEKAETLLSAVSVLVELGDAQTARSQLKMIDTLLDLSWRTVDSENHTKQLRVSLARELLEIMVSPLEGKRQEAVAAYEQFLEKHEEELQKPEFEDLGQTAKGERAILLADDGMFKQALPIFEELALKDQSNPVVNFYLGYCYISVAEYNQAKRLLQQSIKQGLPSHLEFRAHSALGMALYQSGDYLQAKLELERGLKAANPRYVKEAQLYKWLHHTCMSLGLKQEAEYYGKFMRPC
jgi:tetratricopeptide (TPR) repeat protein